MNHSKIQHLLVLMLENRSFDHMLGYLDYPDGVPFEGIRGREGEMGNPLPDRTVVHPGPGAGYHIHPGPGHSFEDVMTQLLGPEPERRDGRYVVTNDGFAFNYATLYNPGHGELALRCFRPGRLPVMATLAQEFAVCDHWFCSVPGATWPNRNFTHAATSDGEVNIRPRTYHDRTIFQQLSEARRDWAVYYGGFPPQSLVFSDLWRRGGLGWLQRFRPIDRLFRAIAHDRLPHYAFVEPDMLGRLSNSQHPGMGGEADFRAAERLIWQLYNALREQPDVFRKSLLVITYDEHGGFFDHVPPPQGEAFSVEPHYEGRDGERFAFDLLGPRVPTLLISPWIPAGTVDQTVYDHASIPATVRRLFAPDAPPLTARDRQANTFEGVASLDAPRADLPEIDEPFVDEAARRAAPEVELRESMAAIAGAVVWDALAADVRSLSFGPASFGAAPVGREPHEAGAAPPTPEEVERAMLREIAPRLSPEAQLALAAAAAESAPPPEEPPPADPDAPESVALPSFLDPGSHRLLLIVNRLKHGAERLLENRSLWDDLGPYVSWALHKYFETPRVVLRDADGASLEQPSAAALRRALERFVDEEAAGADPDARLWLADHRDRWLTLYRGGRITFHDRNPERVLEQSDVGLEAALALFLLLRAGDLQALRRRLQPELTRQETVGSTARPEISMDWLTLVIIALVVVLSLLAAAAALF